MSAYVVERERVFFISFTEQDFCSYLTRHQWTKLIEETKPQSNKVIEGANTENEEVSTGECPQVAKLQLTEQDFCSYLTRRLWTKLMEETKPQSTKLIEETKPQSRVMDLEDNPPMFQDYNVGPIKLSYLASRTTEILEQYSLRKRPRSRVLDVEEPEPSSKKNGVASKRLRVAPKRPCFAAKSRLSENADATLRHALLGNANNHLETIVVAQQVIEHPQCYPDTQTDGVLSSIQIERAWLCEESLHCFGGSQIEWSFVYKLKYASQQKWDDMFECLVQFIKDCKAEELKGASDKEKEEWEWDGNVPTTYKVSSHVGADPNLLLFRFADCVA